MDNNHKSDERKELLGQHKDSQAGPPRQIKVRLEKNAGVSPYPNNVIRTRQYTKFTLVPGCFLNQLRNPAVFFLVAQAFLSYIPSLQITYAWSNYIIIGIILFFGFIDSATAEFKKAEFDDWSNNAEYARSTDEATVPILGRDIQVGDIIEIKDGQRVPVDCIIMTSNEARALERRQSSRRGNNQQEEMMSSRCYLNTKQLDGESNLKQIEALRTIDSMYKDPAHDELQRNQMLKNMTITCSAPSGDLTNFDGSIDAAGEQIPVDISKVLLCGSLLEISKSVLVLVLYTGNDTKLVMNQRKSPHKTSRFMSFFYKLLICYIFLLFVVAGTLGHYQISFNGGYFSQAAYLNYNADTSAQILADLIADVILLQQFVPIIGIIIIAFQRVMYKLQFIEDFVMTDMLNNEISTVNQCDTLEDLAELDHIFSDKTGTLTKNKLNFKEISIINGSDQIQYVIQDEHESTTNLSVVSDDTLKMHGTMFKVLPQSEQLDEILRCILICNDAIRVNGKLQCTSQDEKVLLEMAEEYYDCKMLNRSSGKVVIRIRENEEIWNTVRDFEFTSARKMMSVVAMRADDNQVKCFCKGADEMVQTRLSHQDSQTQANVIQQIESYAIKGLRTLMFAYRNVGDSEIQGNVIDLKSEAFENELTLLGVTGVEDELQNEVAEVTRDFRNAGIKFWMITGDKGPTAKTISQTTGCMTKEMQIVDCQPDSIRQDFASILEYQQEKEIALFISGTLMQTVVDSSELASQFEQVISKSTYICQYRSSPNHKAVIVEFVKKSKYLGYPICCAVGDGANDVTMIQKANVGVGLKGNEGGQASSSADYSIYRFHQLHRIIFYHGRNWGNNLHCYFVNFITFGTTFTLILFVIAMFSGGSAANITDGKEYPTNLANSGGGSLAVIICIYACTMNQYMLSKDILPLEEWNKVNSLPTVYKNRKEFFLRKRLPYYLVWHIYIIYLTGVCFTMSFWALDCIAPTGQTSTVFTQYLVCYFLAILAVLYRTLTKIRTFQIPNQNAPMAFVAICAFCGLSIPYFFTDFTVSMPQFWLTMICGTGMVMFPVYAAKSYYILIVDPDSYTEHYKGALKQFMPKNKIDAVEMTEDYVKEWFESYQEMMKSRQWSDATIPASQVETISQKIRVQQQEIILEKAPRSLRSQYGKHMRASWLAAGGVDNGPIGQSQFFNFVNELSKFEEKENDGYFIYNEYDSKAYFKLLIKFFGNQENEGKLNLYQYFIVMATFKKEILPKIVIEHQ